MNQASVPTSLSRLGLSQASTLVSNELSSLMRFWACVLLSAYLCLDLDLGVVQPAAQLLNERQVKQMALEPTINNEQIRFKTTFLKLHCINLIHLVLSQMQSKAIKWYFRLWSLSAHDDNSNYCIHNIILYISYSTKPQVHILHE